MKHKFNLHEEVDLLKHPGYFGKIIFIHLNAGPDNTARYLLDCYPGACGGYIWCIHPDGNNGIVAANWFNEDELKERNERFLNEAKEAELECQRLYEKIGNL